MADNILTVPTYEQIATITSRLATNYSNLASVFYDVFYNTTPMDVTFQMYNEEGVLQTYTIPNRAKDLKSLLSGEGAPENRVDGSKGTLYQDLLNGDLYIKETEDGNEGWSQFTTKDWLENIFIQGNGDPEGSIVAPKGILYIDASSASLFIKGTDTGNTGWERISASIGTFANPDLSNITENSKTNLYLANVDLSNLNESSVMNPEINQYVANVDLNNLSLTGQSKFDEKQSLVDKVTVIDAESTNSEYPTARAVYTELLKKQATLISSGSNQNIKTINNVSILGSGNISVLTAKEKTISLTGVVSGSAILNTGNTAAVSINTTTSTLATKTEVQNVTTQIYESNWFDGANNTNYTFDLSNSVLNSISSVYWDINVLIKVIGTISGVNTGDIIWLNYNDIYGGSTLGFYGFGIRVSTNNVLTIRTANRPTFPGTSGLPWNQIQLKLVVRGSKKQ